MILTVLHLSEIMQEDTVVLKTLARLTLEYQTEQLTLRVQRMLVAMFAMVTE